MNRFIVSAAFLLAFVAAPMAQTASPSSPGLPVAPPIGTIAPNNDHVLGATQAAPQAALPTPVATQNTITTSGPVTSTTKIETGTYAGQAILWVGSVFGTTIGAALTALILRLLKNAGVAGSEVLRQKLQDMIVNGLNAGAQQAADALKDKGQIEVKNEIMAKTVEYVQAHGADTLKELGVDPNSNAAVDAIKARIETAINDPATPTPPILDPTAAPKAA